MTTMPHPIEWAKSAYFVLSGRRPFGPGYSAHRARVIRAAIEGGVLGPQPLPEGFGRGLDERVIEYPWLFSRLPPREGVLLDAGSVLNHADIIRHPTLAAKAITVMTLAPEEKCFWQDGISYLYGDLRNTCFRDAYFDWIVCLSTLEHIGLDNSRFYGAEPPGSDENDSFQAAIAELARLLKPGGSLYLSVPFGKAADHGWLQVFDSSMLDQVVERFEPSSSTEDIFIAASDGWRPSDRGEAAVARYFDRHASNDLGSTVPAAAEAVACLELRK